MYITGIKYQRLKNKLKCIDIARQVGINQRTYRYWEQGTKIPTNEHFETLAKIFKCSVKDMYPVIETADI